MFFIKKKLKYLSILLVFLTFSFFFLFSCDLLVKTTTTTTIAVTSTSSTLNSTTTNSIITTTSTTSSTNTTTSTSTSTSTTTTTINYVLLTNDSWKTDTLQAGKTLWYYFSGEFGKSYQITWNDSSQGDQTKTCDIIVSVYRNDKITPYFLDNDSGYISPKTVIALATENIYIKVQGFDFINNGTFDIKYKSLGLATTTTTTTISIPRNGLVAEYLFNGNANDTSDNNNNGTVSGAALTTDKDGKSNNAYLFDGVDDYIEVLNSPSLQNITTELTISVWFNQYDMNTAYRIIDKHSANNPIGYALDTYENSTSKNKIRLLASPTNANANSSHSLNQWHHIVVTFDNGTASFYLDGQFDGAKPFGMNSLVPYDINMRIGSGTPSIYTNVYFSGKIDNIRIYNRALTAEEVNLLYNDK